MRRHGAHRARPVSTSGDSACALPPYSLPPSHVDELKSQTIALALKLGVRGLMNVQFAIKDDVIYVLEVNPRASPDCPRSSARRQVFPGRNWPPRSCSEPPLAQIMSERGLADAPWPRHISVKEAVFPFNKFPGVDCILGPEMRSTGEVMGVDFSFGLAFAKAQMAAGGSLLRPRGPCSSA